MKKLTYCTTLYALLLQLIYMPNLSAQESVNNGGNKYHFNIKELAFPSEVKSIGKKSGSIYYSPSVKDKVLVPVHFWGEITSSGLHFIPGDTNLIKGLSMAGGPKSNANLKNITITRSIKEKLIVTTFDLKDGGNSIAHNEILRPGDTIFINKSTFHEDRAYYTSLIAVFATVLSSILLLREVKKN